MSDTKHTAQYTASSDGYIFVNGKALLHFPLDIAAGVVPLLNAAYSRGQKDSHEKLLAAAEELLRVDDEWHGSVNSEMASARRKMREAIREAKA